jgi:glycosyltransferase involved in cell wall biosynthesis
LIARGDFDYALDLANELSEVGVTVTLYLRHELVVKIVDTPNRPIERLYELNLLPRTCKVRLIRLPRMRDPRSFAVFRRLSKKIRNDGVEVAHILLGPGEIWFAMVAYFLRDMPVTSTMIVPKPNVGEELPFFIVWGVHKLLAYGSDMVVVNGIDQVSLVHRLYRIPLSQIAYVPLSVNKTAAKWSVQKTTEEPGTVLFFGRAHVHKGLEYLIKAQPLITRQVPHARILISAHGKDLKRCRQMIQDSNRFEIHEGVVPGNVMATFFQRASLVVLPYLSAASSGVMMTAYTFGKPVVATDINGLSEYVNDGATGFLVPPSDVEQLAAAIARLLSDDALRHQMGENAKRLMDEEQKKITMETIRVYEKAISIHRNT